MGITWGLHGDYVGNWYTSVRALGRHAVFRYTSSRGIVVAIEKRAHVYAEEMGEMGSEYMYVCAP